MSDDNVTKIPVKFKDAGKSGKFLERVHDYSCFHDGPYLIDDKKSEVECGKCGAFLSPTWVLGQLASRETTWHETRRKYQDEMKRLRARSRTKCDYCGNMTRVSRR